MADINQSSWSETDSSNNSASPNGWASGSMLPSQVEPTARGMMGAVKRWHDQVSPTLTSGGTANAQTITHSVSHTAYVAGDIFGFIAGATNTGATTLNVDGLGALAVFAGGAALKGREIVSGQPAAVMYDGTRFQLLWRPLPAPNIVSSLAVANPTGTTSLGGVMMGLGSTWAFTPTISGTVLVNISGQISNNNSGGGATTTLQYGTGTAPANAAAGTGSSATRTQGFTAGTTVSYPMTWTALITGLTPGTAYWFDLFLAATTAGTAALANLQFSIVELRT